MEYITSWMKFLKNFIHFDVGTKVKPNTFISNLILVVFLILGAQSLIAQNIKGTAPLLQPKGGLAIDGNAYVNVPGDDPTAGDWLFENGTDPEGADPGGVFPPEASDGIAEGIPDEPYPDDFYLYPDQTTFFRDNITNNDPTIFTSSNKINDDPNTYTWGTGSSPNKNEIQNAIAHFSYADPTIQYGNEGDLWLAFAADRQVTNGSSYIDFEILQASLTLNEDGTVSSEGPDGGRTVLDLLITIEFTNGGGAATVVVRQWGPDGEGGFEYSIITPDEGTVFGTENDVETIVPYSIYFQDPINEAGFYQYSINQWAEGAVNVSAFFPEDVCVNLSTLFVRTRTSGSSSQSELKDFPGRPTEIEIDLTPEAPGFTDVPPACDSWDGTLTATGCEGTVTWYGQAEGGESIHEGSTYSPGELTETTSYWASCTVDECEGPRAKVTVNIYYSPDFDAGNLEDCEDGATGSQSFDLNDAISNEDSGTLSFYTSSADAMAPENPIGDPTSVSVSLGESPKTFWARLDNDNDEDANCNTIKTFTVSVYDNPDLTVQDLENCEDGTTGSQSFNLNNAVTDADSGSVSFYTSEADALVPQNAIGTPNSYSVNIGSITLWARSDNDSDSDEVCYSVASFDVDVYDNPDLMVQDLADCEDEETGAQTFDLNDAVTDADGGSVSFYSSEADAMVPQNAIGSPGSYSVNIGSKTIWARSDNNSDSDEGCYSILSFDIDVYDNPDFDVTDLAACQSAEAETADFDLNDAISNDDAGSLSFYNSEADALVPQNAIGDPTSVSVGQAGATFWARLDNDNDGDENCYTIKSFDVDVYDNPDLQVQNLADCEDGETGAQTFDLNDGVTDADGGSVSFYNSEADALVPQNAIGSPGSYSVNIGNKTIWARSDNESDGDEACFSIESFNINVYDNPDVTATDPDAICYGESVDLATYVSADGGTLSFHLSQADADNDTNALISSIVSPEVGVTTYYVRSETTNGDDICYGTTTIDVTVEQCDQEGCTLGYWKNHTDRWCDAYSTCDLYGDIFANAPSQLANMTLLQVLNVGGGGIYNLGRQSVAALLNTCSDEVGYAYSDIESLISDVNDAFANGQAGSFGSYLDGLNQAGCPLGGTPATTAPTSPECNAPAASLLADTALSGFNVAPVPFRKTVNVKYDFEYTSNVKIEFYDLNGRLLRTYKDKQVRKGDETQINIDFALKADQVYILRIVTDRESFSKNIISGN